MPEERWAEDRSRQAIHGINTVLVCGRKIFSLNKQDSQPSSQKHYSLRIAQLPKGKENTGREKGRSKSLGGMGGVAAGRQG